MSAVGNAAFSLASASHDAAVSAREAEILLARPQVELSDDGLCELLADKRVLVTGAGGSIGSEIVGQIARFRPAAIALVENSEFALYSVGRMLADLHTGIQTTERFCDVRERQAADRLIAAERPDFVFHVAALKHVGIVEAHPLEGIRTNVLGTRNVADACAMHGVPAMVFISTDKTVNPSCVMGATKRLAEAYCQALDRDAGPTRFVCTRFGNVLGTTGSVVPRFRQQLAQGGPLTVTHPDVSRYFMTKAEAARFVLRALLMSYSSVNGTVGTYVLNTGEPVRIVDLARRLIASAEHLEQRRTKIVTTTLAPGEKLNEELVHPEEHVTATATAGILAVTPRAPALAEIARQISELEAAAEAWDEAGSLRLLRTFVPEYGLTAGPSAAVGEIAGV